MPDGRLWHQRKGIPMGDPISPGMTIGACAWMEHEWMQTLSDEDKQYFKAVRYMDDILMLRAKSDRWDADGFARDFESSTCYMEPLKLESGKPDTFLETRIRIEPDGTIRHWLKNDNEQGQNNVWRYHHYHSHMPHLQKRAILTACLRKVHTMASDKEVLATSATYKIQEFLRLQYPPQMVRAACTYLAASTAEKTWLDVRDAI